MQLRYGGQARAALAAGVDAVADAVATTLGPRGRYVVLDGAVTDDGATVARALASGGTVGDGATGAGAPAVGGALDGPGARLIRMVASVADELAGDGTTTATVLAQAMIRAGLRNVAAGADPVALRRGIERAVAQVVEHLAERQAIGIAGRAQTLRVAAVAAGDEAIGAVVADAFDAVGADGVVNVVRGDALELELTAGMRFNHGFVSPHMITDPERGEAVLERPYVLIANQEVTRAEQLAPVLERVAPTGRPLLVIGDRVAGSALGLLVRTTVDGGVRCVAVKARHVGEHRRRHLEEVALYTGGQSIADRLDLTRPLGLAVEQTQLSQLGRAERVVATQATTTIVGGAGERSAVEARLAWLRREIEAAEGGDRLQLSERLAELAGTIAVVHFGAATETEVAERRARIEDAVRATRAALREGIVPGGGVALLEAGEAIDARGLAPDEAAGAEIVRRALGEPAFRIAANAGFEGAVAVARTRELPAGEGLDVVSGVYGDMIDAGILDPALVARVAVQTAASLAKLVLLTEVVATPDDAGHVRLGPYAHAAGAGGGSDRADVLYGAAARAALRDGVEAVARAVGVTLGPGGRTVVVRGGVTRDGSTVARAIRVADPFAAQGARLLREAAAGAGSTTATVLARALVAAGQRAVAAGADPVALRRGIEHAVAQAVRHVREVQASDLGERLADVAAIAAGDHAIGAAVADAFERVGRDGVVSVEPGHTLAVEVEVALGMRWDKGYVAADAPNGKAVLEHPHVLCVDQRIRSARELLPVLELVRETGRPLLLVVLALEEEPRSLLVANARQGRVASVAVTAPDFLERRRRNLEDIAIVTGGEAITEERGLALERVGREQLGSARRAVATRRATTIVDGGGDPARIADRVAALRRELERDTEHDLLHERLRQRLARLAAGVAAIKVGAATAAERSERVSRAEDAVQAAEAALRDGIVPGGGGALLRARAAIDASALAPGDAAGAEIVRRALEEPLRRIADNAGVEGAVAVARVAALGAHEGLDARTGAYCDLVRAGIVDPAAVVCSALDRAASVAKTILLAECVAAAGRDR